ncbi:MAG: zinc dependent phospholipase C family protein [Evtepia sp.]|uniref:zinc dependent phospholipase C family protein n=1 Tax=Evtepia sp. TaxID=2773933 RepID=UPI002A76248C|nr:zinc dependent phospholipase C family protein [Evtepia sp.]MDY3014515.1 zinc dependent phospholipase C family protein [Evtepia sp.]
MANYNAHTYFGMRVLEKLPPDLKNLCAGDLPVFRMGLYGPDPLILSFRTKKTSDRLHKFWRAETLPELKKAICAGDQTMRSFAAGYMLHQMLDDVVHPRIYSWMEDGSSHFRLEMALDKLILQERQYIPPRLVTDGKWRTAQAAATIIQPVSENQYLSGLWRMAMLVNHFCLRGEGVPAKVREWERFQALQLRDQLEAGVSSAVRELSDILSYVTSPGKEFRFKDERRPQLIVGRAHA